MKYYNQLRKIPGFKTVNKLLKNRNFVLGLAVFIVACALYKRYFLREGFEASPTDFNNNVGSGKKLVWFYANWCGHCKKMGGAWDSAANTVNTTENKKMIKIDLGDSKNDEQQLIVKKYNITGYPTIHLLNNGEIEETYNGGRSKSDFVGFCNKRIP